MLAAGVTLGPYRILAPLGAGGMGEVYRAHDTRLGRDVAVKVLPARSLLSIDARARFEREARTISQLSHPHICTLYDVGREGETEFLVMELLEGETLAHRIARGALPVADVLRLGAEIASALDRAHAAGVVHRDLKPGNVMLTKRGAKLMDFGLARVGVAPATGSGGALSMSPTMTQPLTSEGAIVGTFQYMAPEQLEGREADARSDIWALGCVLYEMATGKRAFAGESQASLISAILRDEPRPIADLQPLTPPALGHVVARCLAKDPADRWQSARDVASELRWTGEGSTASGARTAAPGLPARRASRWMPWAAAVIVLAVVPTIALSWLRAHRTSALPVARFDIVLPAGLELREAPALSPDGRWLAFAAADTMGTTRVWLRNTTTGESKALPGTEGDNTLSPFWSPDSRNLAYFTNGKLVRLSVDGGVPVPICDAPDGRGGAWSRAGVIAFVPDATGGSGIWKVAASGGTPVEVTHPDSLRGERDHRYPRFLPDGEHFLYVSDVGGQGASTRSCWLASLRGGTPRHILDATSAAIFAPPGWLLYQRDSMLVAQRFDLRALRPEGQPRVLASAHAVWASQKWGAATFAASANGLLVVEAVRPARDRLFWFDRGGRTLGATSSLLPSAAWVVPSPDSRQAIYAFNSTAAGSRLWRMDLATGLGSNLTTGRDGWNGAIWSRDGRHVYFERENAPRPEVWSVAMSGSEPERKLYPPRDSTHWTIVVDATTPDDRQLLLTVTDVSGRQDPWLVPTDGSGPGRRLTHAAPGAWPMDISPDGQLQAYGSDETGHMEMYVTTFPEPGPRVRISADGIQVNNGCGVACWVRGGGALVYVTADSRVMEAEVERTPSLHASSPHELFHLPPNTHALGVARDGSRFLLALPGEPPPQQRFVVLVNWQAAAAQ